MQDLVLLHGALGDKKLFDPIIDRLQNEFRCHALNFSGHGGRAFAENFSIAQFAEELDAYIAERQLPSCVVFGHSMGGYTALYSAAKGNSAIQKIMALGTKFEWTPEIAAKESGLFDVTMLKEKLPAFVEQLQQQHGSQWEELVNNVKHLLIDLGEAPALSDDLLHQIQIPATLCWGEKDKMVNLAETSYTASQLPNGKVVTLAAQPHLMERVDLELLTSLIKSELMF